ncbi:MAG TPA: L,D-transpeptidase family protein [Acidimicrobiales bacterium]|nr:L,D-transpeptidase family protein [Acidimicrobiales bacterium]
MRRRFAAFLSGHARHALGGLGALRSARQSRWGWGRRVAVVGGCVLGGAALALAGAWLFGRPSLSVGLAGNALIRVDLGGIGTHLTEVEAAYAGKPLPLEHSAGGFVPRAELTQGHAVEVTASAESPRWLAWLVGKRAEVTTTLHTPTAAPSQSVAFASATGTVPVSFDHPVSLVEYAAAGGTTRVVHLGDPSRSVDLVVPSHVAGGQLELHVAPQTWEALTPAPTTVTWFASAAQAGPIAVADPAPGSTVAAPNTEVSLTFSKPVADVLGSSEPTMSPAVAGSWSQRGPNTLVFVPKGFGFGLDTQVTVSFRSPVDVVRPVGDTLTGASDSYSFTTTQGSVLRLEQLLAQLHYLPLTFVPAAGQQEPASMSAEIDSVSQPPAGQFVWRWASIPASLQADWTVGSDNPILRGALMNFESVTDPDYDGYTADDDSLEQLADAATWESLIDAALRGQLDPDPYSYVYVSQEVPETLTLWENGAVVLSSPCNTGIPERPTANGTFPIYERYTFNYMSGFNPDGSYYHDPVYWINYFNGGDAVHGFPRGSYGWPQSLGCVELPISTAEVAFNELAIGDLVTVTD